MQSSTEPHSEHARMKLENIPRLLRIGLSLLGMTRVAAKEINSDASAWCSKCRLLLLRAG